MQEKAIAALADSKIDIRSSSEFIFKNMKKKLRADIKNKKPKNAPDHSNSSALRTVKAAESMKKASNIIYSDDYVRKIEDKDIKVRSRLSEPSDIMEANNENPVISQLKQISLQKSQQQLSAVKSDDDFLAVKSNYLTKDYLILLGFLLTK